jgi:hypothetical protein
VASPIQLTDIDPTTLQLLSTVAVPTNQVVTSFSSKSELGLQLTKDAAGNHLVFVGYGLAGVGALDVSNSDAPGPMTLATAGPIPLCSGGPVCCRVPEK